MTTVQCAFRLDADLVARIDLVAAGMGRDLRGVKFTRADAVRFLLSRGLDWTPPKKRNTAWSGK